MPRATSSPSKIPRPTEPDQDLPPPTLDRFRSAMKFSLWTWAAYWPGGGLLLLMGGLDPISIIVTGLSLASFIALLYSGALRADSSRTIKEFLLERPLYLVVALALFIVIATVIPDIEGVALFIFATTWFGGLALSGIRLVEHVGALGLSFWKSKADQLLVVLGMAGFFSALVFLDALLPLIADGATLGSPSALVAVSTWVNLLYPGFVLVASKPFRDRLQWPGRRQRLESAAKRRKVAKDPVPFRAS
ncbi:MAG TPA: hypothetical protein VM327_03765 [Candidatus Thermoplasmatota archaeon]|nr:hypothetical protein [Candidatus Thermoplasmatota archaeon]